MNKKRRSRYRKIIGVAKFTDDTTGTHHRFGNTSWYYKNFNNNPGYFLKIGDTFIEFPKASYDAITIKVEWYNFTKIRQEVKKIRANKLLSLSNKINQEVNNESKKSSI